jgi:4-hydroxy-2-oxoglutarate aldolase
MEIRGIFAPLTTPFTAGGAELALDALRENLHYYNRTALAGYVICGSTGEAILLTWAETERLFAQVAESADASKMLIAGTGVESLGETIARTRRAAELGYHAALVRTPHYYKPLMTDAALSDYYQRVADASAIPVLIYSIPQYTGVEVSAGLAARLAQHGNIVGIKDSSGKLNALRELVAATPPAFRVLVGSAAIVEPSLKLGAAGAILGLSTILPELCVELFERAQAGDATAAKALQEKLEPLSHKIVGALGPAGVKCGMDLRGLYGGPPRHPLLVVNERQRQELGELLAALEPAGRTA